ncbi:hypothetical protein LUZ63_005837 [Rhynchospora breviuscula]|uniref:Protein kinase domain-containing protein n=1 Tax=Rhynchospora breviuscula TaxID=2022672 RepID=A0A9Q0CP74_9POAL|nr:hypothetical protein LUZ63_005837 [Rhynchospora breviuscula]
MERKSELPPATSAASFVSTSRRTIVSGDPNLTSNSTSSNSSTSLSPSDPFRHLHAALKRHKPAGTMQANLPRARRVVVSRPSKPTTSKPSVANKSQDTVTSRLKDKKLSNLGSTAPNKKAGTKTENASLNKAPDKESELQNAGEEMLVDSDPTENETDIHDSKLVSPHVSFNDCFTKDPVYSVDNAPQNNIPKPNTEKRCDNISNMHSLALSEGGDPNQKLQNFNTKVEASNIAEKLEEQTQIQNHNQISPATQCSVMHSSCITKVSVDPGNACQNTLANSANIPDNSKETKQVSVPSQVPPTDKGDKKGEKEKSSKKKGYDPDVFFKVNGKLYQKLGKIGSGGSSEVHKVISIDCTIYALKKIKLKGRDYPTALGFCQEIEYLNRLKGKSNIIQLIDYEITDKSLLLQENSAKMKEGRIREDHYIYMVLEYGEIDLAHMVSQKWKESNKSTMRIDENWLRFYWKQMLDAVNTIHEERIVHSDLKPANFLLVRGALKLIDFGIAKAIMNDTTNIQRDAQVGTLNYMSPEAFLCNEEDENGNTIKCGRPSDIWSLGCILYQMVYGKTPFADYNTFWAKFKVVTNKNHEISYPQVPNPWLIDLMKRCLAWDRNDRWRISQLLEHPFLVPPVLPIQVASSPLGSVLERISLYWNHPDVAKLFSQLGEVLGKIEDEEKEQRVVPNVDIKQRL